MADNHNNDGDLAIAIGEDAFRAGWEACYKECVPQSQPDELALERERAWSEYDPPEDLKGRNF